MLQAAGTLLLLWLFAFPVMPARAQESCAAPVLMGICDPFVPGTIIRVNQKGVIPVVATWQNGPAEKAGICPGDDIVAINGISADAGWAKLEPELVSATPGPVRLSIRRGEKVFDVSVQRVRESTLAALAGEKFVRPPGASPGGPVSVAQYVTQQDILALESFRQGLLASVGFKVVDGMPMPAETPETSHERLRDTLKNSSSTVRARVFPDEGNSAGFSLTVLEQPPRALVSWIMPGSPAGAAGLWLGDEVASIEGHSVASMAIDRLRELVSQEGEIVVQVRRENTFRELRMQQLPVAEVMARQPDRPLPDAVERTAETYIIGINALWDEKRNRAVVDYLDFPSPAVNAQVRPGSEIVAVNGKPGERLSRAELARLLSPGDATPISLTLKADGKQVEVRIVPVRYREALASVGRRLTKFGPTPLACPDQP